MATQRHDITLADGWVKVADDGDDFLLENQGGDVVRVFFGASPDENSPFHRLSPPKAYEEASAMIRVAPGDVHISTASSAVAVVSK